MGTQKWGFPTFPNNSNICFIARSFALVVPLKSAPPFSGGTPALIGRAFACPPAAAAFSY
jgi:hypothetical protein